MLRGSRSRFANGFRSPPAWAAGRPTPRPCSGWRRGWRGSTSSELAELAAELGSDVPSQLTPGLVLGTGAGDDVEPRAELAPHAFVIVPLPHRLSTSAVYAEADRLGLGDDELAFAARLPDLWSALSPGQRLPDRLLVNDLEPAAMSLCPDIEPALAAVREAGADHAFVSGSGPTVAGLFWDGVRG